MSSKSAAPSRRDRRADGDAPAQRRPLLRGAGLALAVATLAAPALLPSACVGGYGLEVYDYGMTTTSSGAGGSHGGGGAGASTTSSSVTSGSSTGSTTATTSSSTAGSDGWLPFPAEGCGAEYIVHPPHWPKRTWTSCGDGCLVADARSLETPWHPATHASTAKYTNGDIYVLTTMNVNGKKIQELMRLSDEETLAVLRSDWPTCMTGGVAPSPSPFILKVLQDTHIIEHKLSVYYPKADKLDVLAGSLFTGVDWSWFSWDEGWGLIDGNKVRLGLTPGSAETVTVYGDKGEQSHGHAAQGMVAWVDGAKYYPTPIRRWTKELGVGILYDPPDYRVRLAMSDDTIAWIGGHPDPDQLWVDTATELYWAPWSKTELTPTKGPDITNMMGVGEDLIVGGDHLAITAGGPGFGPVGVIVVQMSTQKKWYLYAPGEHLLIPVTISKTEMLVQELGPQPKLDFLNYRRYDLTKLDELSGPWPGPP